MNRCYRLRRSIDLKRVRHEGKTFSHPLFLLVVRKNEESRIRIAVTANRGVGGAIERNRSKRRLREAFRAIFTELQPGFDIICVARKGLDRADFQEIKTAVRELVKRAQLLQNNHGQRDLP